LCKGNEVVNLAHDCGRDGEDFYSEDCSKGDLALATELELREYGNGEDREEDVGEDVEGGIEVVEAIAVEPHRDRLILSQVFGTACDVLILMEFPCPQALLSLLRPGSLS
jgi:hypothetical protein